MRGFILDIKAKLSKQIHELQGASKVLVHRVSQEVDDICKVTIVYDGGVQDLSVEISKNEADFNEVRAACEENNIPAFYLDATDAVLSVVL
jgi:hypothetical protein